MEGLNFNFPYEKISHFRNEIKAYLEEKDIT